MHYNERELLKIIKDGKTLIGGYEVDCNKHKIQTKPLENAKNLLDLLNIGYAVPLLYYNETTDNKPFVKNIRDSQVIDEPRVRLPCPEQLHNRLLNVLNRKNKTKKKRINGIKKTKKKINKH